MTITRKRCQHCGGTIAYEDVEHERCAFCLQCGRDPKPLDGDTASV